MRDSKRSYKYLGYYITKNGGFWECIKYEDWYGKRFLDVKFNTLKEAKIYLRLDLRNRAMEIIKQRGGL
jgi:hypothetical protein